MRKLIFARHFALGALAAGLLLVVACASPRTGTLAGMPPKSTAAGQPAGADSPGEPSLVVTRDPDNWGSVVFTVNWPTGDRQTTYIHPDTVTIDLKAYDATGSVMLDAKGVPIVRQLEKPPAPATSSTLIIDEVPSGSIRFEATASNGASEMLATGSATASVQGNTAMSLRLILGLPGIPKIYSFSPTRGFANSTSVALTGDNLSDGVRNGLPDLARTVKLGTVAATITNVSNSQQLNFQVPTGAQDASISFTWTSSGVSRAVTSANAFTVITGVTINGLTTVTRGSTFSLTATGSSASSASFALTGSEANFNRSGSTCNPACDGTGGQPSGSNAFTIIPLANPGEYIASASGTASVTAGGGSVTATVTITVNP